MEDIKLIYNNNNEKIVFLNYFTSKIFIDNIDSGSFIIDNNILRIQWNNNLLEIFNYDPIQNLYKINDSKKININNIIYDLNDIHFLYSFIDTNNLKIKINENYESLFKLNNDIFIDITNTFNEDIYIENESWSEYCIINKWNNYFYRKSLEDENGRYEIHNDNLILYWKRWDIEYFNLLDNVYKKIKKNKILLIHKDWTDDCIIDIDTIYKLSNNIEKGKYIINNNQLIINWDKWNNEIFILLDNIYYLNYYIYNIIFHDTNINNILYNTHNLKIYNKLNNIYIGDIIIDKNIFTINYIDNNLTEIYFYSFNTSEYILYKNINKEINIYKNFNEKIILNMIDNTFVFNEYDNKKGVFKYILDNNFIELNYLDTIELYRLFDNIYYYEEYIRLHNKNIYLLNNVNIIEFKINAIDCYLYNEYNEYNKYNKYNKLKFIRNNNIFIIIDNDTLNKYYLKNIDNEYILTTEIEDISLNIFKTFINDYESSNIELYHKFINNKNIIHSIKSFINKYNYFDINNYCNNNLLNNNTILDKENAIIHWYNSDILSEKFYSKNMIDICYISLNNNNLDKNLYIINLDNNIYLENIIENIPKISNVCIVINIKKTNSYLSNYLESLKIYFTNLFIIKYNSDLNIDNYFIFNFIYNKIYTFEYSKIIYLKNYYENLDDIIINLNKSLYSTFYLFDTNQYITLNFINIIKNKYLIDTKNILDIILIIIFLYINYYNIFNKNFIIEFNEITKIYNM
jgi:hypothetical protein